MRFPPKLLTILEVSRDVVVFQSVGTRGRSSGESSWPSMPPAWVVRVLAVLKVCRRQHTLQTVLLTSSSSGSAPESTSCATCCGTPIRTTRYLLYLQQKKISRIMVLMRDEANPLLFNQSLVKKTALFNQHTSKKYPRCPPNAYYTCCINIDSYVFLIKSRESCSLKYVITAGFPWSWRTLKIMAICLVFFHLCLTSKILKRLEMTLLWVQSLSKLSLPSNYKYLEKP